MTPKIIKPPFSKDTLHWPYTFLVFINALLISAQGFSLTPLTMKPLFNSLITGLLFVFCAEIMIKIWLLKVRFFTDHRNIFVIIILSAALLSGFYPLTILLTFTALRSFRSLTFIPKTTHIIDTLFHTIPGCLNIIFLIGLTFFIFATLGTHLFGQDVPSLWGNLTQSMISLQQVMLGDDWGTNLRATMKHHPYAWAFYISFLFFVGLILLNLFVGIIIDSMQAAQTGNKEAEPHLKDQIQNLKSEISALKKELKRYERES